MKRLSMKFSTNNESGMTLVEILIASSILVVVALGFSYVITSTVKQENSIKFKQNLFNSREQQRYEEKVVPLPSPEI